MLKFLSLTLLSVLVVFATTLVIPQKQEVKLIGYEVGKSEIVRKLRLHQRHISKLEGGPELQAYREDFFKRSEQIIRYIDTKKVRFYLCDDSSLMHVNGVSSWIPRQGVFVNKANVKQFQDSNDFTQAILSDELSHMAFWAYDADAGIEKVKAAELPEYSDWYEFIMTYSDRQEYLEKFYLTNSPKDAKITSLWQKQFNQF